MPSGHTNRDTIAARPMTDAMAHTLRRIAKGPTSTLWRDLTQAEQNHVRALRNRGLVFFEGKAVDMTTAGARLVEQSQLPASTNGSEETK